MKKDRLIALISYYIDWEKICNHLEFELDVEINPDCHTFVHIEKKVVEMILEAIKNEPDFTYKY